MTRDIAGYTSSLPAASRFAGAVKALDLQAKYKVISLFAGCGGLDLGFQGGFEFLGDSYDPLPFDVIWANDIDEAACGTYRKNLGDIHCGDIQEAAALMPGRADVVIGGFPCQDVSINGLNKGAQGARTTLFRSMIEVVEKTSPSVFVAENVKGLLSAKHQPLFKEIIGGFESIGYDVSWRLYLAADFGVPQMRQRLIIVGTKKGLSFTHPAPTLSREHWISASAAVKDFEDKPEDRETAHIWSKAKPGGEQGRRVLAADSPATTIRAECHGNIQYHYKLPRRISMREAATFQSFPDTFSFDCGIRQMERQIGNAVPPVMGWHIARSVADCLA